MKNLLGAVCTATVLMAAPAGAATLTGTFDVIAYNATGMNSVDSQATMANFNDVTSNAATYTTDTFTWTGSLDFATSDGTDATTVGDWLSTGSGSPSGLEASFADTQLSSPNINNGSAITTFFLFTLQAVIAAADFTITHDDGVGVYGDGDLIGESVGPNSKKTTYIPGYSGDNLQFLYVATNGDPSILNVEYTPVPVPAALPLMVGGLGLLGFAARRKRKAA